MLEIIKNLNSLEDIEKLDKTDLEKCEIFYTILYMFYRKLGINIPQAKIMVQTVAENAKDAQDDFEFTKLDVSKKILRWCLKGELYYAKVRNKHLKIYDHFQKDNG